MTREGVPGSSRRPRRRRRRLVIGAVVMALLLAMGTGDVIYQDQYDIREERVTIRHGSQTLDGVLARPRAGETPSGLVE